MLEISNKLYKFAEKHQFKCYWCDQHVNLTLGPESPHAATREHIIPRSIPANGKPREQALAHKKCNELRATIEANAFKRLMNGESVNKFDLWPHLFSR